MMKIGQLMYCFQLSKITLTILSAPMCSPTHDLQTSSGQGGHGEPGVGSLGLFDFFFFGFNVNSGLAGGLGPWHLEHKKRGHYNLEFHSK